MAPAGCGSFIKIKRTARDNLDYDPSATTAVTVGSFHGTGISIIQFPSAEHPGTPHKLQLVDGDDKTSLILPEKYTVVPSLLLESSRNLVPERKIMYKTEGSLSRAKLEEQLWLKNGILLLDSENLGPNDIISWSAFHATRQTEKLTVPATTALLPLFREKADSAAMVKHGMDIIKETTQYLNGNQVPVMACDCPIFAVGKQIQWNFPDTLGEDKFIMMFGGLHLEKDLWNALGDIVEGSGWTTAITEADITTSGAAESFLNCSHITRTRHFFCI